MREEQEPYFEEDGYEELLVRYEKMIKLDRVGYFDVEEFESIIDYYLDQHQHNKAFDAFELGFRQHPGSSTLLIKKSQIYLEHGNPYETIKILNSIENMEFFNFEIPLIKGNAYCLIGNSKQALIEFDKAIERTSEEKSDVIYNISSILVEYGQFTPAIKYLQKAYDINPANLDVLCELAYCSEMLGNLDNAIEFYNRFLDEDPFSENIWFNLGEIYEKKENQEKAIDAYDFALAIDPKYHPANFNKGTILMYSGEITRAITMFKEILKFDKKNTQALCCIGEAFEKLDNYRLAKQYYNMALGIDILCADAWYGLGMVEMQKGENAESLLFLKKAVSLDKGNGDYWYAYGKALMKMHSYDVAKSAFEQAIEIDVYDYESWLLCSGIVWEQGNHLQAVALLIKGYVYNSNVAEYNYRLAAYHACLNNKKSAEKYLAHAMDLNFEGLNVVYQYIPEKKLPKYIKSIIKKYKKK